MPRRHALRDFRALSLLALSGARFVAASRSTSSPAFSSWSDHGDEFGSSAELQVTSDVERSGELETYKVFSYNICWGCMEGDLRDNTGMQAALAKMCLERLDVKGYEYDEVQDENTNGMNITRCARNMGHQIAKYYHAIGGYDLMAFQEASNFADLFLDDVRNVTSMAKEQFGATVNVKWTQGDKDGAKKRTWVVSLYNRHKFGEASAVVHGVLKTDRGRPFLILIFDKAKLIFINHHNAQPKSSSWGVFLQQMNERLESAFSEKHERKKYRVIMAGDFNDLRGKLPGCLEIPWMEDPNYKTLSIKGELPKTCCKSRLHRDPTLSGDYIFDSHGHPEVSIPAGYNNSVPQSDHRPVEATTKPGKASKKRKDCAGRGMSRRKSTHSRK